MIQGEFDNYNRPIVEADLQISATGSLIHFRPLIDTGAVDTIIMPRDADRLGLHPGDMPPIRPIPGLGGHLRGYEFNNASMFFHDLAGRTFLYYIDVLVVTRSLLAANQLQTLQFPSILGRGIVTRWKLTLCFLTRGNAIKEVTIDPISHD
jgi:hypothetical protein